MTTFNKNPTPQEFESWVNRIEQIRSQPDYVPEFPPSRLIDDSPRGSVSAMYDVTRRINNERTN